MPLQCICVDNRISRTQLGKLFVFGFQSERNDFSQEYTFGLRPACDKLINFFDSQLDTRDSRLDTRDSRLDTRYSKLSSIESRGSRIEARGTVNLLLSGTVGVIPCHLFYYRTELNPGLNILFRKVLAINCDKLLTNY